MYHVSKTKKERHFLEYTIVFLIGGVMYSLIEVVTRGFTHWTMTLTGGLCLAIMYYHFGKHPEEGLLVKCLFGMIVITSLEFTVGCIVNLLLGWNVWDYSNMYMNLLGQICLTFSAAWFLLSVPIAYLCEALRSGLSKYTAPR